MFKRILDIFFSSLFLLLFSWLYILIGIVIKCKEPNEPILFRQKRVGKLGRLFTLLKFRSMTSVSDKDKGFEPGSNLRVTPLGAFLRKTKLDEIPQLINVLTGEMSIVGPRPEVEYWTKIYPDKWAIVHSVRPGITDNASILFRNEEELLRLSDNPEKLYKDVILPQKLNEYVRYLDNKDIFKDFKIVLKTLSVVLFR